MTMGYLPIDPQHYAAILSLAAPATPAHRLLDPFAGEGAFLEVAARAWNLTPYANELDGERAAACMGRFGARQAVRCDVERLLASNNAFSAAWLNPPYDHDPLPKDSKRVEFAYLRAALQMDSMGEEMKNRFNSGSSSGGQFCSPNGVRPHETVHGYSVQVAKQWVLASIYAETAVPSGMAIAQRNAAIIRRYTSGEGISELAREYGISPQRVFQIVKKSPSTTGDTSHPHVLAEASSPHNPEQSMRPEADPAAGDSASIDSEE